MLLHQLLAIAMILAQSPPTEKTLVAWVAPADLKQRGGSALTVDNGHACFDGIVFGEIAPARWMAGSENFRRSQRDQSATPPETGGPNTFAKIAIVYGNQSVTISRDDKPIASYPLDPANPPLPLNPDSLVIAGIRHLDQGDNAHFAGAIDDMRIYDHALTGPEIAALAPNRIHPESDPKPWVWWHFETDQNEATGRFRATRLVNGASLENGCLILDGKTGSLFAAANAGRLDAIVAALSPEEIAALELKIDTVRDFRHKLLADPNRPAYHFVIPEDYAMPFDPNGAIYWNGRYHLFYIYQKHGAHWFGHASSIDLVHWRHHPPALGPMPGDVDRGMFSGNCFVNKHGAATMLYHGVGAGNCIATSTDPLLEKWTKLAANPIVPIAPEDPRYRSWDPHGWLENDTYYAIFGGERAAIFKAIELDRWTYVGDLLHHTVPGVDLREDISCPDLFKLGGKDVLVCISHRLGARYYVGEWKNEQFHPELHERMSWSDNLYFAPESLAGPGGRRVMWAWIFDQRPKTERVASGWSGEMAIPRELSLGPDHKLRQRPIVELERLRYHHQSLGPISLAKNASVPLPEIKGDTLELLIEIENIDAAKVGVVVRRDPEGTEGTPAFIDFQNQALGVDHEAGPFAPESARAVLRVFVDRGVVEAFADDRQAVVRRCYPRNPESLGVALFTEGGSAIVRRVEKWELFPSNPY
jgi:sucrose-6-phosphate hydrolase SacC (GH32 family)